MTDRSKTDAVLVLVAVLALGFGAVLATVPSVFPRAVLDAVMTVEETVEPEDGLIAIAIVVGLFALWRSYFSGATDVRDVDADRERAGAQPTSESSSALAPSSGPSASRSAASSTPPTAPTTDVVGELVTERVDRTIDALQRGNRATMERQAVVDDLRRSLRDVERAAGRSSEVAAERIRTGAWTDDRVAAVFLGDASAGTLSLWQRLRMWLFPGRTFERRLERTLAELERYATTAFDAGGAEMQTETGAGTEAATETKAGTGTNTGTSTPTESEGDHA